MTTLCASDQHPPRPATVIFGFPTLNPYMAPQCTVCIMVAVAAYVDEPEFQDQHPLVVQPVFQEAA